MSQKQEKKIRKLYRRDLRQELNKQMESFTSELDSLLKPAPRFVPEFIWVKLQSYFLNI